MVDYRVLVTGSRNWVNERAVEMALDTTLRLWHEEPDSQRFDLGRRNRFVLVHGACPTGADEIADKWGIARGVSTERHPADWSTGKSAGPRRNQWMVDLGADVCVAFPLGESKGTKHCMGAAKQAGIYTVDAGGDHGADSTEMKS